MRTEPLKGLLVVVGFAVLAVFSLLLLNKQAQAAERSEESCAFYMKNKGDSELLWDALVRQFTGSVLLQ